MSVQATPRTLTLADRVGRTLGTVSVEVVEDGWMLGQFSPGPDYPAVESVFRHLAEVIDQQSLSYLDAAEEAIAALGLTVRMDGEPATRPAYNVQLETDMGFACRLTPRVPWPAPVTC